MACSGAPPLSAKSKLKLRRDAILEDAAAGGGGGKAPGSKAPIGPAAPAAAEPAAGFSVGGSAGVVARGGEGSPGGLSGGAAADRGGSGHGGGTGAAVRGGNSSPGLFSRGAAADRGGSGSGGGAGGGGNSSPGLFSRGAAAGSGGVRARRQTRRWTGEETQLLIQLVAQVSSQDVSELRKETCDTIVQLPKACRIQQRDLIPQAVPSSGCCDCYLLMKARVEQQTEERKFGDMAAHKAARSQTTEHTGVQPHYLWN